MLISSTSTQCYSTYPQGIAFITLKPMVWHCWSFFIYLSASISCIKTGHNPLQRIKYQLERKGHAPAGISSRAYWGLA